MYCTSCGKAIQSNARFCAHCGTQVQGAAIRQDQNASPSLPIRPSAASQELIRQPYKPEPEDHVLKLFIGKRADEYLYKWKHNSHWNWPAFLFGGYWLIYRGMYLYFLLYLIGMSFMVNIFRFLMFPLYQSENGVAIVVLIATVALQMLLAPFADKIYLHHANRKIRSIQARYPANREAQEEKIVQAGETSLYIPIALAAIPVLIFVVTVLLFSAHTYREIRQELEQREESLQPVAPHQELNTAGWVIPPPRG